jgi:hypothetical protein
MREGSIMESEKNPEYHGNDEIIERNVERSREVIDSRKNSENEGKGRQPTKEDPSRTDDTVAPKQWNVPVGGQAGPNFRGGSSKRRKP